MDAQELKKRLDAQDAKLESIGKEVHKIKQFFLWSFIATIVTFVLPLILAVVLVPILIKPYLSSLEGLI